jgi:hypothetical protein
MAFRRLAGLFALTLILAPAGRAAEREPAPFLARIKAVGKEGAGNAEAAKAWRELVRLGPSAILDILAALDDAEPIAANWLRSAIDTIAERTLADKKPLPAARLEAFVRDTRHAGRARRLAYEWLTRVDPATPDRLLPGMLNDPGAELRRDAIARAYQEARRLLDRGNKDAATIALRELFTAARDADQVERAAKDLQDLGVRVDLTAHYGFLTQWVLIGPFDNSKETGFARVYPPENKVDLAAIHNGKKGEVRWAVFRTADPHGLVDLNKAIGKNMGAVAYAFATIHAAEERPIQLRAGSNNAIKMFLNGKLVYTREEYHHGMRMDQHVGTGTLRRGRNEILVKICQNEQTDDWAQSWSFQLRVCDALGGAVPVTRSAANPADRPVSKEEKP